MVSHLSALVSRSQFWTQTNKGDKWVSVWAAQTCSASCHWHCHLWLLCDNSLKFSCIWAGEMAHRVRALTTLPMVLSSNPSNHMVAHNHLWWDLTPSSGVSENSYSVLMYNNKSIFGQERTGSEQSWLKQAEVLNSIPNNHMKAYNHLYSYSVLIYIK